MLCACQQITQSSTCSRQAIKLQTDQHLAAKNSMAVGAEFSVWRESRDRVFALGSNYEGQLGIPNDLTEITVPTEIPNARALKLSAGSNSVLAYTGCGVQGWGRLSLAGFPGLTTPKEISLAGKYFNDMSAGAKHTLIVDDRGKLYAWGTNYDGQLGRGNNPAPATRLTEVVFPVEDRVATVKQVSAGNNFSMALVELRDGHEALYSWGLNNRGQLGIGNLDNKDTPTPVTHQDKSNNFHFTQISAGNAHSVALGSDGYIYSWGNNRYGQLGLENTFLEEKPIRVSFPANVSKNFRFIQVSAGKEHSVALGSDGYAYAWGNNDDGQLGLGVQDQKNKYIPTRVLLPAGVSKEFQFLAVATGPTANHTLAKGNDNHIYGWGPNWHGQLGERTIVEYIAFMPTRIR